MVIGKVAQKPTVPGAVVPLPAAILRGRARWQRCNRSVALAPSPVAGRCSLVLLLLLLSPRLLPGVVAEVLPRNWDSSLNHPGASQLVKSCRNEAAAPKLLLARDGWGAESSGPRGRGWDTQAVEAAGPRFAAWGQGYRLVCSTVCSLKHVRFHPKVE